MKKELDYDSDDDDDDDDIGSDLPEKLNQTSALKVFESYKVRYSGFRYEALEALMGANLLGATHHAPYQTVISALVPILGSAGRLAQALHKKTKFNSTLRLQTGEKEMALSFEHLRCGFGNFVRPPVSHDEMRYWLTGKWFTQDYSTVSL